MIKTHNFSGYVVAGKLFQIIKVIFRDNPSCWRRAQFQKVAQRWREF